MPKVREDRKRVIIKGQREKFHCDDEMILYFDCGGGYKIDTCGNMLYKYT